MNDTPPTLSRRRLLAGVGAAGVLGGAGLGWLARGPGPRFTSYTYAQAAPGTTLTVAWYESYNGTRQEATPDVDLTRESFETAGDAGTFVDTDGGPVVTIRGVLPGDRGRLVVGLRGEGLPLDVWARLRVTGSTEGGIVEPERGLDTTPEAGELGTHLAVTLWTDGGTGNGGSELLGACNGRRDLGEPVLAAGPIEGFVADGDTDAATVARGVRVLDTLPADTVRCVALEWGVGLEVGDEIQSDAVEFELTFAGVEPGAAGNPFEALGTDADAGERTTATTTTTEGLADE